MTDDDGRGPYTYCRRGLSWCEDQRCDCVDSARYRVMYQMARERDGRDLALTNELVRGLALWMMTGAIGGLMLLYIIRRLW